MRANIIVSILVLLVFGQIEGPILYQFWDSATYEEKIFKNNRCVSMRHSSNSQSPKSQDLLLHRQKPLVIIY